jgi:hypothetical protein
VRRGGRDKQDRSEWATVILTRRNLISSEKVDVPIPFQYLYSEGTQLEFRRFTRHSN